MTSAGRTDGGTDVDDGAVIETYGNTDLPEGTPERPLVTFALFAYNQEKYIREAVEGAFSQTYSPLEIILSDDCSSDRTFEIMREMARGYRGPHLLKVRRGEVNIGVLAHVLSVAQMATGEIIIVGAGDDISMPERSEITVNAFSGVESLAFSSDDIIIDDSGKWRKWDPGRIERRRAWHARNRAWVHGAAAAYKAKFLKELPIPSSHIFYEDMVFSDLVSLLGGSSIRSSRPLIKYRYHFGNLSSRISDNDSFGCVENQSIIRWRRARDAKKYCIDFMMTCKVEHQISKSLAKRLNLEYEYLRHAANWQSAKLFERLKWLYFAARTGNTKSALARAFGQRLFFALKSIKHA